MSKAPTDEDLELIIQKRSAKRKQEFEEKQKAKVVEELNQVCYTAVEDPEKKHTKYLVVKIKYDIKTMKAIVEDMAPLEQDVIGKRFPLDQEQLEVYYKKGKKRRY